MPDQHAKLSPSAAYRWFECPGSVEAQAGAPDDSNPYAREGTAAHALAEKSLLAGLSPSHFLGERIDVPYIDTNGKEQVDTYVVNQEMADHVAVYTEWCRTQATEGRGRLLVEQRVGLAPVSDMLAGIWGTSDCVIYFPLTRSLYIVDLKYGRGKVVEAEGNLQLRIYALAAWATFAREFKVDSVTAVIIQPRAGDKPVRLAKYKAAELLDFAQDVEDAVQRIADDPHLRLAGPWCDWCKAKGTCPAFAGKAMEVAQDEFALVPAQELTMEQAVGILEKAELLEDWIKGIRAYLHEQATRGVTVPGYKMVPKRAERVWIDPDKAVGALAPLVANDDDLYAERKLLSVAQMEKVVGKKNLPGNLWASVSSGFNLVRDTDSRPGVSFHPGDDFAAITHEESNP